MHFGGLQCIRMTFCVFTAVRWFCSGYSVRRTALVLASLLPSLVTAQPGIVVVGWFSLLYSGVGGHTREL